MCVGRALYLSFAIPIKSANDDKQVYIYYDENLEL